MRALSVRQPWAWAICYAGKCVENREWSQGSGNLAAARRLVGQDILIHAAKGCTRDEYDDATDFMAEIGALNHEALGDVFYPPLSDLPRGAIVARARLVDVVRNGYGPTPVTPWAIRGCTGLILADVRPLAKPVPFKGALGFFEVPDSILEAA